MALCMYIFNFYICSQWMLKYKLLHVKIWVNLAYFGLIRRLSVKNRSGRTNPSSKNGSLLTICLTYKELTGRTDP